jgi:hypothetical protein
VREIAAGEWFIDKISLYAINPRGISPPGGTSARIAGMVVVVCQPDHLA